MAQEIVLIDGFEDYPGVSTAGVGLATYWLYQVGFYGSATLVPGRVGGQGVRLNEAGGTAPEITHLLPLATERADFFGLFMSNYTPLDNVACDFWQMTSDTGERILALAVDGLRNLTLWQGNVLLATSPNRIFLNTWYSVSIAWTRGISDGTVQVAIDGELVFDITNAKTVTNPDTAAGRIVLSGGNRGNGRPNKALVVTFDDVRVDIGGSTLIEEGRYFEMVLSADQLAQWTPLTGDENYKMVDDTSIDGDTTYNETNTVGNRDLFSYDMLPFNPDKIHAMRIAMFSRKVDVATRRNKIVVQSGADEFSGPDKYESTNYFRQVVLLPKDVDSTVDAAWTKESVFLHRSGYELVE